MVSHLKHKICQNKACAAGNHTFIPAAWQISGVQEVCNLFVCQHCLLSVDKTDREVMKCHHDEIIKEKMEKEKGEA